MEGTQLRATGTDDSGEPGGEATDRGSDRSERLAAASRELETVLESVDLAAEPELADALVHAVAATQRAHDVDADGGERPRRE